MMEADERKRLADAMRVVSANFSGVLSQLEKGAQ
jgi:hypothetical protein